MQAYQTILPDIRRLDATLVAISPQLPDNSLTMAEKNALEFEVLSDSGNAVARDYGIVWRYSDELRQVYRQVFKIALPEFNGSDSWELPIPATLVIGRDGIISYAFVDPDYTRRAEPEEIRSALRG